MKFKRFLVEKRIIAESNENVVSGILSISYDLPDDFIDMEPEEQNVIAEQALRRKIRSIKRDYRLGVEILGYADSFEDDEIKLKLKVSGSPESIKNFLQSENFVKN